MIDYCAVALSAVWTRETRVWVAADHKHFFMAILKIYNIIIFLDDQTCLKTVFQIVPT